MNSKNNKFKDGSIASINPSIDQPPPIYTTTATSLNWLVVTIAKTNRGCEAIERFFHALYFKPCIWTYRDVLVLFLLSVLCLFPYNVDMTATSWGALRHTQRERHAARERPNSNGSINRFWSSFKWSTIHSNVMWPDFWNGNRRHFLFEWSKYITEI